MVATGTTEYSTQLIDIYINSNTMYVKIPPDIPLNQLGDALNATGARLCYLSRSRQGVVQVKTGTY